MRTSLKSLFAAIILAAAVMGATGRAHAAALKVSNAASLPIAYVYVSPSSSDTWSGSQLLGGDQYIMPGDTWILEFAGGSNCYFDLKAVFIDATVIEHDRAYLCGPPKTWTVGQ